MGEVRERAAGALEEDGVGRMGGGEGVARLDSVSHQPLPIPAAAHRLLLVDLGLCAPHRGGDGNPGFWRSILRGDLWGGDTAAWVAAWRGEGGSGEGRWQRIGGKLLA